MDDLGFLKRFVSIVAPQRSGTTALQSAIAESPEVDTFFEIFHGGQFGESTNFFNFLATHEWAARYYIAPSEANMEKVFLLYLRFLSRKFDAKHLIIDVKDNSLHNLNRVWQEPNGAPYIVNFIRKFQIPVIRIERRNIFLQELSIAIAVKNKQYHYAAEEDVPQTKVNIDAENIARAMQVRDLSNQRTLGFLSGYQQLTRLIYEEIFDGRRLSDQTQEKLKHLFPGVDLSAVESPLVKINKDPRRSVANVDEIIERFRGHQFESQIQEALG